MAQYGHPLKAKPILCSKDKCLSLEYEIKASNLLLY